MIRFPKPRPRLLDKKDMASLLRKRDAEERAKCRQRSEGQCEVMTQWDWQGTWCRCLRKASENHHLLGGIGRRNKGKSILAAHRLDVCATCHREITGHVLVPVNAKDAELAATVRYERQG